MGRHRVKIELIEDERIRQVMFLKRKQIINRKLYELAVVCGCEISCICFTSDAKLWEFSSTGNTDEILMRYADYSSPHEIRSIADYERMNGEDPAISEFDMKSKEAKETRPAIFESNYPPNGRVQPTRPMPLPINTSQIQNMQWANSKHYMSLNSPDYTQQSPVSARSDMAGEISSLSRKRGLFPDHLVPSSAYSYPRPIFSPTWHGATPIRFGTNSRDQFHPPAHQDCRKEISFPGPAQINPAHNQSLVRTVLPPPPLMRRRSSVPGSEWPLKTPPLSANTHAPTRSIPLPGNSLSYNASPTEDHPHLSPKRLKLNAIYKMLTPPGSANEEVSHDGNSLPVFLEPNLRLSPSTSGFS